MKQRIGGFWILLTVGLAAHVMIISIAVEHW